MRIEEEIKLIQAAMQEQAPNAEFLELYKKKRGELQTKAEQLRKVEERLVEKRQSHDILKLQRCNEFKTGFQLIAHHV